MNKERETITCPITNRPCAGVEVGDGIWDCSKTRCYTEWNRESWKRFVKQILASDGTRNTKPDQS